ncbi:MAG: ComEA family DNA-binding protein [Phycisphaeraceae bacterium]
MQQRHQAIAIGMLACLLMASVLLSAATRPEPREAFAASESVTFRIDPNLADAPTLCLLPQVGPGIAERIVNDREVNGPFVSADDMQRVPYVGAKTKAAFAPWVVFEPAPE